jgi:hypothetical protein
MHWFFILSTIYVFSAICNKRSVYNCTFVVRLSCPTHNCRSWLWICHMRIYLWVIFNWEGFLVRSFHLNIVVQIGLYSGLVLPSSCFLCLYSSFVNPCSFSGYFHWNTHLESRLAFLLHFSLRLLPILYCFQPKVLQLVSEIRIGPSEGRPILILEVFVIISAQCL